MAGPNQTPKPEQNVSPTEQLQAVSAYIDAQLASCQPWMEDGIEIRETRGRALHDGTMTYCGSRTTPGETMPTTKNVSRLEDGQSNDLSINADGTFDVGSHTDAEDIFEKYGITEEEALQDPDFLAVLDGMHRMITEVVPETQEKTAIKPLLDSVVRIEPIETDRTSTEAGFAELPLKGDDAALVDEQNDVYGVFDGLGSVEGSDMAARMAAKTIQEHMAGAAINSPEEAEALLIEAVNEAHQAARLQGRELRANGLTTATVAKLLHYEDSAHLVWASVGDSRLYVKDTVGNLTQVSSDEGEADVVDNALGRTGVFRGVKQHGILPLTHGSEVILVTDGITGDKGDDILSDQEILGALAAPNAHDAAQALIDVSRKRDDKTAIVVRTTA